MNKNDKVSGHVRERQGVNGVSRQLVINYKDPATGERKRKTETVHCTKKQADKLLTARIDSINKYGIPKYDNRTISEYLEYYLSIKKEQVKSTTYSGYIETVKNRITPYIGGVKVSALTPFQVQQWISDLQRDGKSAKSIKNAHNLLHNAYELAIKYEIVEKNPCTAEIPKVRKKDLQVYSKEEIQLAKEKAKGSDMHLFVTLFFSTGMRRGEAAGLHWPQIDFDKKVIIINNNRVRGYDEVEETSPKSISGIREVPITADLLTVLEQARDKDVSEFGADYLVNGYVLHTKDGTPYQPDSLSQKWQRFLESNNLRPIRLHDIRHTVASQMISKNVNPKAVQDILGHATSSVTMDTYSHAMPNDVKNAADVMGNIVFGNDQAADTPAAPKRYHVRRKI